MAASLLKVNNARRKAACARPMRSTTYLNLGGFDLAHCYRRVSVAWLCEYMTWSERACLSMCCCLFVYLKNTTVMCLFNSSSHPSLQHEHFFLSVLRSLARKRMVFYPLNVYTNMRRMCRTHYHFIETTTVHIKATWQYLSLAVDDKSMPISLYNQTDNSPVEEQAHRKTLVPRSACTTEKHPSTHLASHLCRPTILIGHSLWQ